MHPSVEITELKTEIEKHGHEVIRISNIRQNMTQKPLPLFLVEIKTSENNKQIYEINKLLNLIVGFEPPLRKQEIPQCTECQEYRHTKNYCNKVSVCVKYAKNHLTKDCHIKEKTTEVKCAYCDNNHPSRYKGCIVRKQLQQKLFPTLREMRINHNLNTNVNKVHSDNVVSANVSYAQATAGNVYTTQTKTNQEIDLNIPNSNNNLENMITQLMTKIDTILNLITCLIQKIK